MSKKIFAILLLLILCTTSVFAAETFVYNNISYTIDLVPHEDGVSFHFVLTAIGFVDSSSVPTPPQTITAKEIYELLGYDGYERDSTDISRALASLEEAPITVEKSDVFENFSNFFSGGGYTDENGMFIPESTEEVSVSSELAPVKQPAENEVKVVLREQYTGIETPVSFPDQKPVLVNDRTMIPARGVFEQLGYFVDWNDETSTASVSGNGITVSIPIDSEIIYKNNEEIKLDVPAQLIGGRTMIPLRAVSQALGLQVEWEGFTNSVIIYY